MTARGCIGDAHAAGGRNCISAHCFEEGRNAQASLKIQTCYSKTRSQASYRLAATCHIGSAWKSRRARRSCTRSQQRQPPLCIVGIILHLLVRYCHGELRTAGRRARYEVWIHWNLLNSKVRPWRSCTLFSQNNKRKVTSRYVQTDIQWDIVPSFVDILLH